MSYEQSAERLQESLKKLETEARLLDEVGAELKARIDRAVRDQECKPLRI